MSITRETVAGRLHMAIATWLVAVTGLAAPHPSVAQSVTTPAGPVMRTTTVSRVARSRIPSVVFIQVQSNSGDRLADSIGAGVVIDQSGLIVTNAHVVGEATRLRVEDANGRKFEAEVVGKDLFSDLALIRTAGAGTWRPAPLGRSGSLAIGLWVVAIGNPLGLHHTVTLGIVSGLARALSDDQPEFIQTDAAVNPGNSGGGLFDLEGNLVGITSGSYSTTGGSMGLNFAIPAGLLRDVLPQLKTGGVTWGWIGLTAVPLVTAETGGLHGTPGPSQTRVIDVVNGGPAAMAGIQRDDVLVGVGSRNWPTAVELMRHIRLSQPGTTMRVQVVRAGRPMDIDVKVERPPGPR